jgi:hypothetical protein
MSQNRVVTVEWSDNVPGSGPWRAVALLPGWLSKEGCSGIQGGATKEGPWVDARGYTPHDAVANLYSIIGRAVIRMKAEEMGRGPQPPNDGDQ